MLYPHKTTKALEDMAARMRKNAIELAHQAGRNGAHLGGGLSAIEILAVLYGYEMRFDTQNLTNMNRDRFILSKGHATLAYYTALHEAGILSEETLKTYEKNGGALPGQPSRNLTLGIESASGSLGMGLSVGVGLALAAKMQSRDSRIYVLLGDGECNEGSVWEAAMSAVSFELSQLVAIVDCNGLQSDGFCSDVLHTAPLKQMWEGFGWHTEQTDGHDVHALVSAFDACKMKGRPCAILADTIKGKGVSFMENRKEWHHNSISEAQYQAAMEELSHA